MLKVPGICVCPLYSFIRARACNEGVCCTFLGQMLSRGSRMVIRLITASLCVLAFSAAIPRDVRAQLPAARPNAAHTTQVLPAGPGARPMAAPVLDGRELGVPAPPEAMATVTGGPPELGLALAVDGQTLEIYEFSTHRVIRRTVAPAPPGVTFFGNLGPEVKFEQLPVFETRVSRVDATKVVAQRVDGRAVPSATFMRELATRTAVVFTTPGVRIDPVFMKMLKPETLVLSFPLPTPELPAPAR